MFNEYDVTRYRNVSLFSLPPPLRFSLFPRSKVTSHRKDPSRKRVNLEEITGVLFYPLPLRFIRDLL